MKYYFLCLGLLVACLTAGCGGGTFVPTATPTKGILMVTPEGSPTPMPTQAPISVTIPAAPCEGTYSALFIADVTIPDGSTMLPGQAFVKTWRIRNTGTCSWSGVYLVEVSVKCEANPDECVEELVDIPEGISLVQMGPSSFIVPSAEPGEEVDITVNLTAPASTGSYGSLWVFQTQEGQQFLDELYSLVNVQE